MTMPREPSIFDPEGDDAKIGRNVLELRKARGMSQEDLARELTNRGYPFHQPMVAKVEAGRRALRLNEAMALAAVLECDIAELLYEEAEITATTLLLNSVRIVGEDWQALQEATRQLLRDLRYLKFAVDAHERRAGEAKVAQHALDEAATYLQLDPVDVVTAERKRAIAEFAVESEGSIDYLQFASDDAAKRAREALVLEKLSPITEKLADADAQTDDAEAKRRASQRRKRT